MADFEKMDEIEEVEDGVYLCRFTYKYAIFLDMPKCGMDVHKETWAKALYRMNPCLSKVWFGLDEFINAFIHVEGQCGDYGIAARKIAWKWAEAVYGKKICQVYCNIHWAYEHTVGTKDWCQMDWNNIGYYEVKGDDFGCILTSFNPSLYFIPPWYWEVTLQGITKWSDDNGYGKATTIYTHQAANTQRWDLLKMIDCGVPYVIM